MKRISPAVVATVVAAFLFSCNDTSETTTTTDSATISSPANDTSSMATTPANSTPLSAEDSGFVMEAVIDGMVEVETGNVAQQNAANDRVKAFAQMIVADHSQANNELKSLVSGRVNIPESLPEDKRHHLEEVRKMTGKSFDRHYVQMMVSDHQKAVSKFANASKNLKDQQLKQWADKTLPVLRKHLDSIRAISRARL